MCDVPSVYVYGSVYVYQFRKSCIGFDELDRVVDSIKFLNEENLVAKDWIELNDFTGITGIEYYTIKQRYYDLIDTGKLKEAYKIKHEPSVDFETFASLYKNVESIEIVDAWVSGKYKNRYKLKIKLVENGKEKYYFVEMEYLENGKLKTISSKEI